VVHRAQHSDDPGRFSGYRHTSGGRDRGQFIGCLAADFQRRGASSVCLAYAHYRRDSLVDSAGHSLCFRRRLPAAPPCSGLASLTLALAIYLFAEGVLELVLAFVVRPILGSGWLILDGIITLILAGMIWKTWPSSTEWVIGTLVGISMLFSGISRLMLSLAARRLVSKLA
jgi:hypothetical protein